jgi:UDP-glucose 4-epimerase
LAELGHDVTCTSRKIPQAQAGVKKLVPFDLASPEQDIARILEGIDVVFHLAWGATPGTSNKNPLNDLMINTVGTVRLFASCAKAGVTRIVFASSGGQVYGDLNSDQIVESAATNPKSAYGIGKLSCEKYLALYSGLYGVSGISLRVANLFGPGQILKDGFGVVPTFLTRLKNSEVINLFGNGNYVRDFVYIEDVVDAFVKAMTTDIEGAFNISSGTGISILQIVTMLEQATGLKAILNFTPPRPSDPISVVLDNNKARQGLNWMPKTDFSTGLALVVQSLQEEII